MAKKHLVMIQELGRNLDRFAGEKARKKVLERSENLGPDADSRQIAEWIKEAMERLDKAADGKTRSRVMEECGRSCAEASETIQYQYYMPRAFSRPRRCFCSLLSGLPAEETVSPTYCQCSRGFALKMWESILGRPVKVDVVATAVSGTKECKFKISL